MVDVPWSVRYALASAFASLLLFGMFLCGLGRYAGVCWAVLALSLVGTKLRLARPPMIASGILSIFGVLYLWFALGPETQSDALHYHLALAMRGEFSERVTFYDLIPQGVELLFAAGAPRLLHLSFLMASVPLLIAAGRKLGDSQAGWIAAAFYFVTPVAGMAATTAFNDAAMGLFVLASFYLLLAWLQAGDDRLLWMLGVTAGFCYAIKFTGGLIAPAVFLVVLVKGRTAAFRLIPGVAAMAAPWMIRAAVLTGNPFAPLMNRFFPNPYFHIESEEELGRYLRSYGDIPWTAIPRELAIDGDALQGLLGPAWLLAPLVLVVIRKRECRWVLGAAAVAGAPWILNIGARFLIPALPLLALALAFALPGPVRVGVLAVHAILSLPPVIPYYASPAAWSLASATQGEDREIAVLIDRHTALGDRVLDLGNAPAAITHRDLVNGWQTAEGERLVRVLYSATSQDAIEWRAAVNARIGGLRIRFPKALPVSTGIYEIRAEPLRSTPLWSVGAWPNVWESPFAIDGNPATAWWTWQRIEPGMFFDVEFPAPEAVSSLQIVADRRAVDIEAWAHSGSWRQIPLDKPARRSPLNLRVAAMRHVAQQGITHVLGSAGDDGFGRLSLDMAGDPSAWNLERIASHKGVTLYRLRPQPALPGPALSR